MTYKFLHDLFFHSLPTPSLLWLQLLLFSLSVSMAATLASVLFSHVPVTPTSGLWYCTVPLQGMFSCEYLHAYTSPPCLDLIVTSPERPNLTYLKLQVLLHPVSHSQCPYLQFFSMTVNHSLVYYVIHYLYTIASLLCLLLTVCLLEYKFHEAIFFSCFLTDVYLRCVK